MIDKPDWAFDICASEYIKYLSDDFHFVKKYLVRPRPIVLPFGYDLIHVFWWGENYYKRFYWPKKKILKEVSSHRWEDDPRYGPCTPAEFSQKYLDDAGAVVCTSARLYNAVQPFQKKIYKANNGYSPQMFFYSRKREGNILNACWVGNSNDSVKGIKDILIPAAQKCDVKLDVATDMKHDQLCTFYNDHDLFLVGSMHEASPLTLIEAMACGCFPVCTDVGIVPELITHKKNGFIVRERSIIAFQEAFLWCSQNVSLVRNAGIENAQIAFDKRRWEVCAESYRSVYAGALSHD